MTNEPFTLDNTPGDLIAFEEGFRAAVYLCPTGYPTVGYGRRVRVLDYETGVEVTFPISRENEAAHLERRIDKTHQWLTSSFPEWYRALSPQRQAVLISLTYQVGKGGFNNFKKMIAALAAGDCQSAANEYLDSTAARQTPKRFARGFLILRDNLTIDEAVATVATASARGRN